VSYYDIDKAHPQDLIVSYVLDLRRQGCFLPYTDYHIVSEWLRGAGGDVDELLLVLSEVLPQYYADGAQTSRRPRTLSGARKLVLSRLNDRAMRKDV
jgi:hypothetical protein